MAGIEKICEFSSEHCSWRMYNYKRNQLQIQPKFRKEFRGAEHTLYICKGERYVRNGYGSLLHYPEYKDHHLKFFSTKEEFDEHYLSFGIEVQEYDFCLHVTDKKLQGNVDGFYFNSSTDMSTVKRKLKRLLRCKKLNIKYVQHDSLYTYIRDYVHEKTS